MQLVYKKSFVYVIQAEFQRKLNISNAIMGFHHTTATTTTTTTIAVTKANANATLKTRRITRRATIRARDCPKQDS